MRSKNWQQKDKPPPEGGASMGPGEVRRIFIKAKKASLHRPPLLSLIQFRNGLKEHLYCSIRACVLNHAAPDTERMGFQTSKAFFIHKRQPYFFNISAVDMQAFQYKPPFFEIILSLTAHRYIFLSTGE
jgi:hypothetical protein